MEQVTPAELQRAFLALGLGALLGLAMAVLSRRRG
jgi:LPXTG-motif cell wall-anchored protein